MSIIVNRHITFIDSLQFYDSSLDNLASNLNNEDFKYLVSEFGIDKLEILRRKDAYPYERVDGHISDEQYLHLQNFWYTFNFNTFEDFQDYYLKKDVLLLADVFEKIISTCLKYYGLDPCHYFSAPELSCDVMLKMTKVELEKISDPDKYMFFEQGMRGEVSYINKWYSKANNEYCKDYDKEKPKKYYLSWHK